MSVNVGVDQLIELARYLGVGGALALLIVGGLLVRRTLRIGGDVDLLLDEKERQIVERDRRIEALTQQVDERQTLLDKTLELATVLKNVMARR